MKKINLPVLCVGILLVIITLVSAAFAWWLNERYLSGPGGIPLPPRTKVLSTEFPREGVVTVSCSIARPAPQVAELFTQMLLDDGWESSRQKPNIFSFTKEQQVLRLVLHPHGGRTDFTINRRTKNTNK